jgi:hypothetical protein
MSRRPRAPISLRVLGREPSVGADVAIDVGPTHRLPDPVPVRETVALAPPVASSAAELVDDVPRTPAFPLAPAVDVVPATLVGVYDRVPIGAIAGAATTPRGLQLRLQPGARATPGLLVVGRRRSSGALVTVEVPAAASPK